MDNLIIKGLELFGFHGVNQEEKAMGQKFIVDAVLTMDMGEACEGDSIDSTINYAVLCRELQNVFTSEKHDLIERAAEVLCEYVLMNYGRVDKIDLTLKKPWAPVHMPLEYPAVRLVRERHVAYLALGSNLGDREENLKKAVEAIEGSSHTSVLKVSKFIETDPVGYEDQDPFLNGAVKVETLLSPKKLIRWLLSIEEDLKRVRTIKWGPRTIDLDVIYYDDMVSDDEEIVLPHPRMHERAFVLDPMNEIAPYALHPILKKRTFELLDEVL
ncbi:dihydroneopterin aldolase / 2-amino-4-hydroxy-6-hydroxymethyldihydropteridine diphosphokinase [Dethiosulfatibacter aminovorans DSM 17477]|uniref:Bifunctional folate synthesis protein n=1 Tax=Dethiosulfatibacter aminovorans DSM 17477 TaxID=1121476 RepID=A0A1M6GQH4_9FIRM|nr:2-amino-4-hydroxy-6-hydroxymethyldihydropteridine diphosphokinase [Dethiosulfatibacter aminovorans]SHJ12224.1 dihydroneopterin aldolase / 2-amino-4-hydroxy-6-hydroxymethyldihydropteridine diphosphokinase [Dethiosulfatibacter aminovorans DSM 17477]